MADLRVGNARQRTGVRGRQLSSLCVLASIPRHGCRLYALLHASEAKDTVRSDPPRGLRLHLGPNRNGSGTAVDDSHFPAAIRTGGRHDRSWKPARTVPRGVRDSDSDFYKPETGGQENGFTEWVQTPGRRSGAPALALALSFRVPGHDRGVPLVPTQVLLAAELDQRAEHV